MLNMFYYGTGFPILCLHGWGFDRTIWSYLISDWPENFQMLTVDLPGHGNTGMMTMSRFTDGLLQQLPSQFAVIGWSLGGLYALHLAQQAGSQLAHFFGVATSPRFIKQDNWPGIEPIVLKRFYKRYSHDPLQTVNNFIELQFLSQSSKGKVDYSPSIPSNAESGLSLLQQCDFRDMAECVKDKASYLLGEQDAIVPVSLACALKEQLNINDIIKVKGCGHMPFLSHTSQFIQYLRERLI